MLTFLASKKLVAKGNRAKSVNKNLRIVLNVDYKMILDDYLKLKNYLILCRFSVKFSLIPEGQDRTAPQVLVQQVLYGLPGGKTI
ncbi:hypothetical protein BKI52_41220 [marine bacterium AO1-C]|nr:hypothetical protein BKI52_41220 [marine bacterium AO1-C]